MADKKAPLLSVGQLDLLVEFGGFKAKVTTVFCPDVTGLLLSWLDCKALRILHDTYPNPVTAAAPSVVASVVLNQKPLPPPPAQHPLLAQPAPMHPSAADLSAYKNAFLQSYADVFDQTVLRCMAGPEMDI